MEFLRISGGLRRLALLAALALGLVAGGGHRVGVTSPDPVLRAYLASGGDLAALCGDFESLYTPETCDVCRLLGAAVLPHPCVAGRIVLASRTASMMEPAPGRQKAATIGWRSRGPPGRVG